MAVNITINGVIYSFPTEGDQDWGPQVTAFAQAISSTVLYKSGGTFTLTGDIDFGPTFGIKAIFKSRSANIATTGVLRLANLDAVSWRNFANSGDINLVVNASNKLAFNSTEVLYVNLAGNGSIPMQYGGFLQQIPIGSNGDVMRVQGDAAGWEPYLPPRPPVAPLTNGYGIQDIEHGTFFKADTSGGAITAALPNSGTHTAGTFYEIKDTGSNAATNNISFIPQGGDLINNVGGYSIITDGGSVKIISDGTDWWTIGGV